MPGAKDRKPSEAGRPPVSRVGDELQQQTERDDVSPEEAEAAADQAAREKLWDQEQTRREGG